MKSAGKNGSTVQSTLHLNSKNFDSWYYSSTTVYLNCTSGIVLLVTSRDGIKYDEFVIHRVVRIKPGIFFNMISISNESTVETAYAPSGLNQKQWMNLMNMNLLSQNLMCMKF